MPELVYTKDAIPTSEQFRADLEHAMKMANPVDDLLELADELREFETQYNMRSEEFYTRFQAGVLDDELQHCMEWAAAYDMFVKTRRLIEATMMRAAVRLMPQQEEIVA